MSSRHTDGLRPDATLPARMTAARLDGEETALDRAPRRNPWSAASTSPTDRVLARMWARGYTAGHGFGDLID